MHLLVPLIALAIVHHGSLWQFLHFFYLGSPWWTGAVWGNVFVIVVVAPLGYLWSKLKFWPLKPLEKGQAELHEKVDRLHDKHDELAKSHEHLLKRIEDLHDKFDTQ